MPTTAVFASLCVLGAAEPATVVHSFVRPMERVFASYYVATLPSLAYETHLIVRRGSHKQAIRLRTKVPYPALKDGTSFVPSCNPVS